MCSFMFEQCSPIPRQECSWPRECSYPNLPDTESVAPIARFPFPHLSSSYPLGSQLVVVRFISFSMNTLDLVVGLDILRIILANSLLPRPCELNSWLGFPLGPLSPGPPLYRNRLWLTPLIRTGTFTLCPHSALSFPFSLNFCAYCP